MDGTIEFGEDYIVEKELQRLVANETLERYSGSNISEFQPYLILTNFSRYVEHFAYLYKVKISEGAMFKVAHCRSEGITILDFKIGSPAAALVMDLCSYLPIYSMLLLGMCGGLREEYKLGEYFVPVASIRGDGTSDFYFSSEVPALANFTIQKVVTDIFEKEDVKYHLGITYTTNKRFWMFNNEFKSKLKATRSQVVEMECATIFSAGYSHHLPTGALLLISDLPFQPGGHKTKDSAEFVFKTYMPDHIEKGIKIIRSLVSNERLKEYRKFTQ